MKLLDELELITADITYEDTVYELYCDSIARVNEGPVRLGWNINIYPGRDFINESIRNKDLLVCKKSGEVIGAAVVNYTVNPEYDDIDWKIKEPKDRISTIHALTIAPGYWGKGYSSAFLNKIIDYCQDRGDIANHLDVIDTNTYAEGLYLKNGFNKITDIEMYYEVVGTRTFAMLEYVFKNNMEDSK